MAGLIVDHPPGSWQRFQELKAAVGPGVGLLVKPSRSRPGDALTLESCQGIFDPRLGRSILNSARRGHARGSRAMIAWLQGLGLPPTSRRLTVVDPVAFRRLCSAAQRQVLLLTALLTAAIDVELADDEQAAWLLDRLADLGVESPEALAGSLRQVPPSRDAQAHRAILAFAVEGQDHRTTVAARFGGAEDQVLAHGGFTLRQRHQTLVVRVDERAQT